MWVVVEAGPEAGRVSRIEGDGITIGGARIAIGPDGHLELRDEGAEEGVFVDGERVTEPVPLSGDEKIRLGDDVLLRLSVEEPEPESDVIEVPAEAVPELADALGVEPEEVRRGRWRALVRGVRETREAGRRALAAAAVALGAALVLGILLLTGAIGGDDGGGAGGRESVAQVVRKAADSTVLVRTRFRGHEGTGSGFALDRDEGLVVTNFHVINNGNEFDVRVGDDFRDAEVVGAAPCDDLAVLKVDDSDGLKTLPLGSQKKLAQGQQVVALGFPASPSLRGELTSTAGVVAVPRSSFRLPTPDSPRYEDLIQTDAALNPGNSGGPLLDSEARLVGVNTAIFAARRGPSSTQGYAIGVDRVKEVVADLRKGHSQRWLGAGMIAPPKQIVQKIGRTGLLVTAAVPGTAAAASGLQGVLLTSVNGKPLDGTIAGYCDATEGIGSGEAVQAEAITKPGGAPEALTLEMD